MDSRETPLVTGGDKSHHGSMRTKWPNLRPIFKRVVFKQPLSPSQTTGVYGFAEIPLVGGGGRIPPWLNEDKIVDFASGCTVD
jgi:hypothetical protein